MKAGIEGDIGKEILFYNTVNSTNTIAAELAERGAPEGLVVLADSQQKGRGRLGRTWLSPPGVNIYMSIILRPVLKPRDITLITLMAAISCTIALRRATGLKAEIKWPNDLMVSNKKIGGILTELKMSPERIIFAVTGIGINVNVDISEFADEVKEIATSVKNETGIPHSRTVLIREILDETDRWRRFLNNEEGRKRLLSEWQHLTSTLGKKVMVIVGKERFTGLAESIDDMGMLILRLSSGELKKISSGDLTILRG
ncbi:MAG: biotin--[acetyl-CoA-carboxylase] ligase [Nitrospirota bacterium]